MSIKRLLVFTWHESKERTREVWHTSFGVCQWQTVCSTHFYSFRQSNTILFPAFLTEALPFLEIMNVYPLHSENTNNSQLNHMGRIPWKTVPTTHVNNVKSILCPALITPKRETLLQVNSLNQNQDPSRILMD